jgi:hypothetical protein
MKSSTMDINRKKTLPEHLFPGSKDGEMSIELNSVNEKSMFPWAISFDALQFLFLHASKSGFFQANCVNP